MKRKKLISTLAASALSAAVICTTAAPAFAGTWTAPTEPIAVDSTTTDANGNVTGNVITTAGHRAAQTLIEIVGLDNRACQNMAGNKDGQTDGATDQADPADNLDYGTYTAAGDNCNILGMFGSSMNENPDPYYYNYYYNLRAKDNNLATTNAAVLCMQYSQSPNNADTVEYNNTGVSASVLNKPEILIGTAANKKTNETYVQYINALRENGNEYDDYNPYIFNYKYNTVYQEGESLQRLAKAMNELNAGTLAGSIDTAQTVHVNSTTSPQGKVGRYGDPVTIANDYMLYVKGLSAYVYKEAMAKYGSLKTVAVIDPLSSSNDENIGSGYFRAYDNTTPTGLAKYARGAECIENVTTNLATTRAGSDDSVVYQDGSEGKSYKVSAKLVADADVIVLQGVQSNYGTMTKDEFIAMMNQQGYDVSNKIIIDSNPLCVYGLTCNSSETAMGYGYYMGFIYPEILDPVDAIAFFDYKIMHLADEDSLQNMMDRQVADAVADMEDPSTKLSADWYDSIKADIQEGVEYYNNADQATKNKFYFTNAGTKGTPAEVSFTDEGGIFTKYDEEHNNTVLKADTKMSDTSIKLSKNSYTYNGKAKTPSVSITSDGKEVSSDDYTVSYQNNTKAGTATVSVTAVQGSGYTGTADVTFRINKAAQTVNVTGAKTKTVKAGGSFKLSGNAIGKVSFSKKSGNKAVKVSRNGKISVAKTAKSGKTYNVKVNAKAAATANYKAATKTVTVKVTVR